MPERATYAQGAVMGMREVEAEFLERFGAGDYHVYHAPGRVNLIGEHTDYNGGYVFPCALNIGTLGVARGREDGRLRLVSANFQNTVEAELGNLRKDPEHGWGNYIKAVALKFIEAGYKISGFDLYISGNIPNGAGLSSSASVELLTAVMLKDLYRLPLSTLEMVTLCRRAENEFIGVNCGIMDQFSVGMGKAGSAILLNCRSLDYEYVPLELDGYSIVIGNTNKRRELAESKYNERLAECEEAVLCLQKELDINCLGELSAAEFERSKNLIGDSVLRKRARHVVYENARTLDAVKLLRAGGISGFGQLMNASHVSLRDDYEVTGRELDVMAEEALKIPGVIGARMTGAGFGGCTVAIVRDDCVERYIETVGTSYSLKTGITPEFYRAGVGAGAGLL